MRAQNGAGGYSIESRGFARRLAASRGDYCCDGQTVLRMLSASSRRSAGLSRGDRRCETVIISNPFAIVHFFRPARALRALQGLALAAGRRASPSLSVSFRRSAVPIRCFSNFVLKSVGSSRWAAGPFPAVTSQPGHALRLFCFLQCASMLLRFRSTSASKSWPMGRGRWCESNRRARRGAGCDPRLRHPNLP